VRLGPQHVRSGRLRYRQAKNEHRNPIDVDIPVHHDLQRSLDAAPSKHLTYLVTEFGKPHTPNGFGNKFKDWCRQADLPHCSAHGLRKAAAARLAERGATAHEIMAITGHQSLEEVERYTRAASAASLQTLEWKSSESEQKCPTSSGTLSANFSKKISGDFEGWRSLGESNPCFSLERPSHCAQQSFEK